MGALRSDIDPFSESAFTLGNRALRAVWTLTWLLLFRPSPRPFHGWRSFLLKLFGATLGRGCHVYPSAQIWAPWNLHMEDRASLGDRVICYSMAPITLGRQAVVSQGAHLCTGSHDYRDRKFRLYAEPISIGADAWVCADCFVHPGVTIGEGTVVGARSVVTHDLPDWMVCAGHPCKELKKREYAEPAEG